MRSTNVEFIERLRERRLKRQKHLPVKRVLLSLDITGLPPHQFDDVKLKVERRGWDTRWFDMRRHAKDCQRCALEREKRQAKAA